MTPEQLSADQSQDSAFKAVRKKAKSIMLHSSVSKSSLQEVLDLHMENWNRLQKLPQSSGITDGCISAGVSPDYSLSPQKKLCCYLWIYIPFMLNMAKSDGKKIYFTNLPTPVQTSCSYKPVL